ncbi:MAG: signal recognition particle protein Srp54 [Conexivisphaera sp.]|nr:signal recognition particle protein Srp54 [Conexivisphaerales archaeon]
MLESLREGLRGAVDKLLGRSLVDEKAIKDFVRDVQRALLQADVNVKLVLELSKRLEDALRNERPPPGISMKEHAIYVLYNEIVKILGGEDVKPPTPQGGRPLRIMLVGLQGSGKTTTAAKLALYYRDRKFRPGLVAADTYRPGAYDQLRQLAERIGVPFYGDPRERDAIKLARDGSERLAAEGADVIIVDTAGRHKNEAELMEEMREIERVVSPDMTFLVVDATIGQQAERQARAFAETTKVGGLIVTKLDSSAKGGGALTTAAVTGAKVYFTASGEALEDFEEYSPKRFAERLLGMGDLETLVEKFRRLGEEDEERAERLSRGKFTLVDFVEQLESLGKMGPFSKLLEMLPGGSQMKLPKDAVDGMEDKVIKWRAAINSMTPKERENPEIINGQRLRRIARGAGLEERDVRELLRSYEQAKKLAKAFRKSRLRGLPKLGA